MKTQREPTRAEWLAESRRVLGLEASQEQVEHIAGEAAAFDRFERTKRRLRSETIEIRPGVFSFRSWLADEDMA